MEIEPLAQGKKHAVLSPSGADRWMTCPGSVLLTKDLPDSDNPASIEGTDYHLVGAVALTENQDAAAYIGRPMPSGALVSEDNAEYLQEYLDLVRKLSVGGTLLIEEEIPLTHITGEIGAFGTSDAPIIRLNERELIVVDLKFGRGVEVQADNNRQCKIYALGVIEKHQLEEEVDTIRLVISQPRAGGTSEWTTTMKELLAFKDQDIKLAVDKVIEVAPENVNDYLHPSEKACRFCKAKGTCPALLTTVANAMIEGFENLITPTPGFTPMTREEMKLDVPLSRADRLGLNMKMTGLAEIWTKGARAEVEEELLKGEPVTGFKLVQGRKGNRKWTNEAIVEATLKSFRLKKEEMYDFSLISPASAEKLLKKEFPKRWEKVLPLYSQSDGSTSVASQDDPRPEIVITKAEEGFEVVSDQPAPVVCDLI